MSPTDCRHLRSWLLLSAVTSNPGCSLLLTAVCNPSRCLQLSAILVVACCLQSSAILVVVCCLQSAILVVTCCLRSSANLVLICCLQWSVFMATLLICDGDYSLRSLATLVTVYKFGVAEHHPLAWSSIVTVTWRLGFWASGTSRSRPLRLLRTVLVGSDHQRLPSTVFCCQDIADERSTCRLLSPKFHITGAGLVAEES